MHRNSLYSFTITRFITLYLVGVIAVSLITFASLMLFVYVPAVRESSINKDITPGAGLIFVFYVIFSGLSGLVAPLPIAFTIKHLWGNRNKQPHKFYKQFIE